MLEHAVLAAIELERVRARTLVVVEVATAFARLACAERLRTGPVAKRGARSHIVWRRMLARHRDEQSACAFVAAALQRRIAEGSCGQN